MIWPWVLAVAALATAAGAALCLQIRLTGRGRPGAALLALLAAFWLSVAALVCSWLDI